MKVEKKRYKSGCGKFTHNSQWFRASKPTRIWTVTLVDKGGIMSFDSVRSVRMRPDQMYADKDIVKLTFANVRTYLHKYGLDMRRFRRYGSTGSFQIYPRAEKPTKYDDARIKQLENVIGFARRCYPSYFGSTTRLPGEDDHA